MQSLNLRYDTGEGINASWWASLRGIVYKILSPHYCGNRPWDRLARGGRPTPRRPTEGIGTRNPRVRESQPVPVSAPNPTRAWGYGLAGTVSNKKITAGLFRLPPYFPSPIPLPHATHQPGATGTGRISRAVASRVLVSSRSHL